MSHAERRPWCFDNGRGAVDSFKVELRAMRNWWQDSELWTQGGSRLRSLAPVELLFGVLRVNGYIIAPNDTEFEAIDRLFEAAEKIEKEDRRERERVQIVPVDMIVTGLYRDLVREIMRERWQEVRGAIPLKELHARQIVNSSNGLLTCQPG